MSIRFSGDKQALQRALGNPTTHGAYSITCFAKLNVPQTTFESTILYTQSDVFSGVDTSQTARLKVGTNGRELVGSPDWGGPETSVVATLTPNLPAGEGWFFLGLRGFDNEFKIYQGDIGAASLNSRTTTNPRASSNLTTLRIGDSVFPLDSFGIPARWFDGCIAHLCIYSFAMSDAQFLAQAAQATPVTSSGLISYHDFDASTLTEALAPTLGSGSFFIPQNAPSLSSDNPQFGVTITGGGDLPSSYATTSLTATPASLTGAATGTSTITITDQNGAPVEGATATSSNAAVCTVSSPSDALGRVTVTRVAAGSATITFNFDDGMSSPTSTTASVTLGSLAGPPVYTNPSLPSWIRQMKTFDRTANAGASRSLSLDSMPVVGGTVVAIGTAVRGAPSGNVLSTVTDNFGRTATLTQINAAAGNGAASFLAVLQNVAPSGVGPYTVTANFQTPIIFDEGTNILGPSSLTNRITWTLIEVPTALAVSFDQAVGASSTAATTTATPSSAPLTNFDEAVLAVGGGLVGSLVAPPSPWVELTNAPTADIAPGQWVPGVLISGRLVTDRSAQSFSFGHSSGSGIAALVTLSLASLPGISSPPNQTGVPIVRAGSITSSGAIFDWLPASNFPESYQLAWAVAPFTTWNTAATVTASTRTYNFAGLLPSDTDLRIRVRGANAAGPGAWTESATFRTLTGGQVGGGGGGEVIPPTVARTVTLNRYALYLLQGESATILATVRDGENPVPNAAVAIVRNNAYANIVASGLTNALGQVTLTVTGVTSGTNEFTVVSDSFTTPPVLVIISGLSTGTSTFVVSDVRLQSGDITEEEFSARVSNIGPVGYSDFGLFVPGDYRYQQAIYKVGIRASAASQPAIRGLKLIVDVPDIFDSGEVMTSSTGVVRVSFNRTFWGIGEVVATLKSSTVIGIPRVTNITLTGFDLELFDLSGARVSALVGWAANGY